MKKTAIFLLIAGMFLLVSADRVLSQQALIRDFAGTVETMRAGSAEWEKAVRGQAIESNTVISTGFKSTAVIAMGSTILTMRPLTRVTLTELSHTASVEKSQLNLSAGRVRAEINLTESSGIDFTVRSSASTASVRGTTFEYDTFNLNVLEGTVEFSGNKGIPVLIDAPGASYVTEIGSRAVRQRAAVIRELRPGLPIASEAVRSVNYSPDTAPSSASASGTSGFRSRNSTDLTATVGF